VEVCPETELITIEDPATVCDGSLEIGEGLEAQMIRHMRHGSSPRLRAPQLIRVLDPGKSLSDSISRSPYDTSLQPEPLRRLSLSTRDHQPRRLALRPLSAEPALRMVAELLAARGIMVKGFRPA
jgi:hypothetical protein